VNIINLSLTLEIF